MLWRGRKKNLSVQGRFIHFKIWTGYNGRCTGAPLRIQGSGEEMNKALRKNIISKLIKGE